jgi:ABC-type Mn2+/Zn2+ transport system permease subunit
MGPRSPGRNPDAVLFGNVLGVSPTDVWGVLAVTAFATAVVFFQYRPLLFSTFDPEVAAASGVKTGRIDVLRMLVLALSILATMNVMGVTLIAAGIVIPAVVARLITSSFHSPQLWGILRLRRDGGELPPQPGVGPGNRTHRRPPIPAGLRRHCRPAHAFSS